MSCVTTLLRLSGGIGRLPAKYFAVSRPLIATTTVRLPSCTSMRPLAVSNPPSAARWAIVVRSSHASTANKPANVRTNRHDVTCAK